MLHSWLRNWIKGKGRPPGGRPDPRLRGGFKPTLEALEGREVPSAARALPIAPGGAAGAPQVTPPPVIVLSHTAATKQVTPDNLAWSDYRVVDGSKGHAADTIVDLNVNYDGLPQIATFKSTFANGRWTTEIRVQLTGVEVTGKFNPNESWVVKGAQTPALLAHERLHFRMAKYIADRFAWHFKHVRGYGKATSADKATSIAEALKRADADLLQQATALKDRFFHLVEDVNAQYDRETNHGAFPEAQMDWALNWPFKLNALLSTVKS